MVLANQFLTVSDNGVAVHLLHDQTVVALYQGMDIAAKRDHGRDEPTARWQVYKSIFKDDVRYCFPVTEQGMAGLAQDWDGPHQRRVQYVAACLALGEPIEPESSDDSGGSKVERPAPLPSGPPGTLAALFDDEETKAKALRM